MVRLDEETLGLWPRRLLHVPTMTSYEWQPGNVYGSIRSPLYNIITYTWGRWMLDQYEMPEVKALGVKGVPWKIPRIHPSHFTAEEFKQAVQRAQGHDLDKRLRRRTELIELPPVEFIWLDIACIDQRRDEPDSALEIGRQAQIFKGAQNVFIWLCTLTGNELRRLLDHIPRIATATRIFPRAPSIVPPSDKIGSMQALHADVSKLVSDPWFTSLWTLQEIFLRPDCVFLSKDAKVPIKDREDWWDSVPVPLEFRGVLNFTVNSSTRMRQYVKGTPAAVEMAEALLRLLEKAGLTAIASLNFMAALPACSQRTTIYDEDRIYAIQQIFGFKLGITAPSSPEHLFFTREELEIQFTNALFSAHPIRSQIHVITRPVPVGTAWRMHESSIIPDTILKDSNPLSPFEGSEYKGDHLENHNAFERRQRPTARLSVLSLDGSTWGHFIGRTCSFQRLETQCSWFDDSVRPNVDRSALNSRFVYKSLLTLHLDDTDVFQRSPQYRGPGYQRVLPGTPQRDLAKWLAGLLKPEEDLIVLALGPITLFPVTMYCLILLRIENASNGASRWRRLGYCSWILEPWLWSFAFGDIEQKDFFFADTDDWVEMSGYFG